MIDNKKKIESDSPFNWRNKPSSLTTGKFKKMFNGVNDKKSLLSTKLNPTPNFLQFNSKVNNKSI